MTFLKIKANSKYINMKIVVENNRIRFFFYLFHGPSNRLPFCLPPTTLWFKTVIVATEEKLTGRDENEKLGWMRFWFQAVDIVKSSCFFTDSVSCFCCGYFVRRLTWKWEDGVEKNKKGTNKVHPEEPWMLSVFFYSFTSRVLETLPEEQQNW